MNTSTQIAAASGSGVRAAVFSILIGLGIVYVAGHLQAHTLHDAAHDMRHSTGFPCH